MKDHSKNDHKEEIKAAIKHHENNNEEVALKLYKELIAKGCTDTTIFMNAGAIQRKRKEYDEAVKLYRKGLYYNSKDERIWGNYANVLQDKEESELAIYALRKSLALKPNNKTLISLSKAYAKAGYTGHATKIAKSLVLNAKSKPEAIKVLTNLFEAIARVAGTIEPNNTDKGEWSKALNEIEESILQQDTLLLSDKILQATLLTQAWINIDQLEKARQRFKDTLAKVNELSERGEDLKSDFSKQLNALGWNLSIYLLKKGKLEEGWSLYDNGLRVEAEGKQKWQRSLKKPLEHSKVPVWKGEDLTGKSLVLLGEQGIGDTMMFSSLIPTFKNTNQCKLYFMPGSRLIESYKRIDSGITILEENKIIPDIEKGNLKLDFQLPVGSLPSRGFNNIEMYKPTGKVVAARKDLAIKKRKEYLSKGVHKKCIIGISWQGGGKANRIKMKSVGLGELIPLFEIQDCIFVSLQYGDDGPNIKKFNKNAGTSIIHDDDFDPVLRIDEWLSQVEACDAVITVANTTLHAAGLLEKPSLCLLSNQSDWRWIDESIYSGCYWYNTIDVVYQDKEGSWKEAISQAKNWIENQLVKIR